MCGIVMTFGGTHALAACKRILAMQQHRGRDQQAIRSVEGMHIGVNRLAIVDQSELGTQPFETDTYIVAINGEIYNHQELREQYQLTTKGNSDIEIIAPLFALLGESIIDVLDGFYAGIIIHKLTKRCYFLRDYIGKKPLFYTQTATLSYVTSELKGIAESISFESIPKGISILNHGHIQSLRSHTHESLPKAQLKTVLREAVQKRIPPHGEPFGVFLSGGLDSSIVAAIVQQYSNAAQYYCLGDENNEDYRHVQLVAEALDISAKVNYIPLPAVAELEALIPTIIYHTESYNPSIISNGLATYLLARQAAKDGLKVILSGEGADELFCGYAITKDKHEWFAARTTLIENLHQTELRRLDLTSMAVTIEARCPFLDRAVYAIAQQLTINDLIQETDGLQGKYILRQLFKDALPERIVQRKKMSCDVGSGIRKAVVEFSTKQQIAEKPHLQTLWQQHFASFDASHPYFSTYPVFDPFIAQRKAIHKDTAILQRIERMLLEDYQQTAFHNLLMGKERTAANLSLGGTCSDKTLHFKSVLAAEGIQTKLHTALINGRATHRLLSVQLLGKLYFIDVGSGWPCVQLFPAFQSYSYSAFGIHFRTKLHKEQLVVDINTHTEFKPLMVIPLQAPSQEEIQAAIANRYHPSKEYPFSHSLRLSFVKGQQFYFIKGNRLRIYQAQATCIEQELSLEDIKEFIAMHVPQLSAFYHTRLFLDY